MPPTIGAACESMLDGGRQHHAHGPVRAARWHAQNRALGGAVIGLLGTKLAAIFGHQPNADEVGQDKIRELGVQKN